MKTLENKFVGALKQEGIAAEVTFCRINMFSILVEDAEQFAKAKSILAKVQNATFDNEEIDDEFGHIAFYRF